MSTHHQPHSLVPHFILHPVGLNLSTLSPPSTSHYHQPSDPSPTTSHASPTTSHQPPLTTHPLPITSHPSTTTSHLSSLTTHQPPLTNHLSPPPATFHPHQSSLHPSPTTSHSSVSLPITLRIPHNNHYACKRHLLSSLSPLTSHFALVGKCMVAPPPPTSKRFR